MLFVTFPFKSAPVVLFEGMLPGLELSGGEHLVLTRDGSLAQRGSLQCMRVVDRPWNYFGPKGLVLYALTLGKRDQRYVIKNVYDGDDDFLVTFVRIAHVQGVAAYEISQALDLIRTCIAANRVALCEEFPVEYGARCVAYITDEAAMRRVVEGAHSRHWGVRNMDAYRHDCRMSWTAIVYCQAILWCKGFLIDDPVGLRYLARYRGDGVSMKHKMLLRQYAGQRGIVF